MASDEESLAIGVWNALENGHGGLDWAGLDLVVAWFGVQDVEGLLHRLMAIKAHKPKKDEQSSDDETGDA